jgi:hypothetical protein
VLDAPARYHPNTPGTMPRTPFEIHSGKRTQRAKPSWTSENPQMNRTIKAGGVGLKPTHLPCW